MCHGFMSCLSPFVPATNRGGPHAFNMRGGAGVEFPGAFNSLRLRRFDGACAFCPRAPDREISLGTLFYKNAFVCHKINRLSV